MADMAHLIEPVIPALRRYARTFVRDAADADDLVQDTLERAISRWHQRRSDGDTRTWLLTILHNLAVNRLRRAARRGREVPFDTRMSEHSYGDINGVTWASKGTGFSLVGPAPADLLHPIADEVRRQE